MSGFAYSVNKFLSFNEYQILEGDGHISREQEAQKALIEYGKFNRQQKLESDFDRQLKKLIQKKSIEDDMQ